MALGLILGQPSWQLAFQMLSRSVDQSIKPRKRSRERNRGHWPFSAPLKGIAQRRTLHHRWSFVQWLNGKEMFGTSLYWCISLSKAKLWPTHYFTCCHISTPSIHPAGILLSIYYYFFLTADARANDSFAEFHSNEKSLPISHYLN